MCWHADVRSVCVAYVGEHDDVWRAVAAREWGPAAFQGYLLLTFFCGAAVSGFCTEFGRRRRWESIFVLPIALEIAALALFALLLIALGDPAENYYRWLYPLAGLVAAAMGLQNATITHISSGIVRTTHVTGVITDLGHEGAQFLCWLHDRRANSPPAPPEGILRSVYHHPPFRRLTLLAGILWHVCARRRAGNAGTCVSATLGDVHPGFISWLGGLPGRDTPDRGNRALEAGKPEGGLNLPAAIAIYHLRRDQPDAAACIGCRICWHGRSGCRR